MELGVRGLKGKDRYLMRHSLEKPIRRFAESANNTVGEYFPPRDVVRLTTTLVFSVDHEVLRGQAVVP